MSSILSLTIVLASLAIGPVALAKPGELKVTQFNSMIDDNGAEAKHISKKIQSQLGLDRNQKARKTIRFKDVYQSENAEEEIVVSSVNN